MKLIKFVIACLLILGTGCIESKEYRIKMEKSNGVYVIPCKVNGVNMRFIFDTGASDVCISSTEANFMLKNGYLNESDIEGYVHSKIANGDIVESTRIVIKRIDIGELILKNIDAVVVHNQSAPLLLGQSALSKLGKIQLDGDELIIFHKGADYRVEMTARDKSWVSDYLAKGDTAFVRGLYFAAIKNYKSAMQVDPYNADVIKKIAFAMNKSISFEDRITYNLYKKHVYDKINKDILKKIEEMLFFYNKAVGLAPIDSVLYENYFKICTSIDAVPHLIDSYANSSQKKNLFVYNVLSKAYFCIQQYENAIRYAEYTLNEDPFNLDAYYTLGQAYLCMKKYNQAIKFVSKGFDLSIKDSMGDLYHMQLANIYSAKIRNSNMYYVDTSDYNSAVFHYNSAFRENEYDSYSYLKKMADLEENACNFMKSIEYYKKIGDIENEWKLNNVYFYIASEYCYAGEFEKALLYLDKITYVNCERGDTRDVFRAVCYWKLNNIKLSKKCLQEAYKSNSFLLGRLRENINEWKREEKYHNVFIRYLEELYNVLCL